MRTAWHQRIGRPTLLTMLILTWTDRPAPAAEPAITTTTLLPQFSDVTNGPLGAGSWGVAWGDYDLDGDIDLYLGIAGANLLARNDGDTVFTDATSGPLGNTGAARGVAWGDYDNDGDLDLYLVNGQPGQSNRLFRNDGGGVFVDATSGPLGNTDAGSGVAWGDYDNDGDLDLYLANVSAANKLFCNDGGGVFVDATSGPLGNTDAGAGVAWGDYDNDGDLDLYLANDGAANKLFRNDGGGTFTDATSGPLGSTEQGAGVAWGDYDNDGDLDLYLANRQMGQINRLFRNDGGGVFVDVTSPPLENGGLGGEGVAWGDYDNDGDLDLFLVTGGAGSNKLLRNDGGGVFTDATSAPIGGPDFGQGVAWGDYDGDGDLDLYVCSLAGGKLYRNNLGAGNHWLQVDLAGNTSNRSGIGARVRVVAGGSSQIREISGGSGYFSQNSLTAEFGLGAATVVDTLEVFWPSGLVDQLLAVVVDQPITLVEAQPPFSDVTGGPLGDANSSNGAAWGDYDNDGDPDLYLTNTGASNKLFRNDGGGVFADATSGSLGDTGSGFGAAWGDYDDDGDLDLYLVNSFSANKLFRNDGGGVFTDATSGPLGDTSSGRSVAWGDYDNDGDLDLYLTNNTSANKVFRNDGGGVFADATSAPLDDAGAGDGVAWGDYDNDGDLDLYLANSGSANKLFRNDGGGVFADATSAPLDDTGQGRGVAWGDYDNDGDLDLYLANLSSSNRLYRNDGGGVFVDATSGPLAGTGFGFGVAWGDYDNDGDLDLYLANNDGNMLLRNNGGGAFADVTSGALGDASLGRAVAWGDYDEDGDLDLYLANGSAANKLFRNNLNTGSHWLHVDLVGVFENAAAIGRRVRIVAGGSSQIREISGGSGYDSQNSLTAEFGLGGATTVDTITVAWSSGLTDRRIGVPVDQRITITETPPFPLIDTIEDIANDQGRQVRITWGRSGYDAPGSPLTITQYVIYREIDPGLTALAPWESNSWSEGDKDAVTPKLALPPGWDFIATVPAFGEDEYSAIAPTLKDSTIIEGIYHTTFMVRAASGSPFVYYDSPADSGYSVDNLEPGVPQAFIVTYATGTGNQLDWDPPPDEDFQYHRVYRSTDPNFDPSPADLVDVTTSNAWTDPDFDDGTVHYRVTAVDFSGNESDPAWPQTVAAADAPVIPRRFALYQNVPNPFNPITSIRYDVPTDGGRVTLRVYDARGRVVRTLVDSRPSPGERRVFWNGNNDAGFPVASGVYFYRLKARGVEQTRKMLLLR